MGQEEKDRRNARRHRVRWRLIAAMFAVGLTYLVCGLLGYRPLWVACLPFAAIPLLFLFIWNMPE